jgi:hypothetical protein
VPRSAFASSVTVIKVFPFLFEGAEGRPYANGDTQTERS